MEAVIVNFRRGRKTVRTNQMILSAGASSRDEADKLVGKKVTFKTEGGKEIKGEIRSAHGNSGAVRAIFERGMPGQSIGKKVTLQ